MEIENLETLKIETESGDFVFVHNQMYYEYYDKEEDEDYQVLIWNGEKLQGFDSIDGAEKCLTIFLEYEEKSK